MKTVERDRSSKERTIRNYKRDAISRIKSASPPITIEQYDEANGELLFRIVSARNRSRLLQKEVAEKMGISTLTYSRMENGTSKMSPAQMLIFAEITEVSLDYLYGRTSSMDVTKEGIEEYVHVPLFTNRMNLPDLSLGYNWDEVLERADKVQRFLKNNALGKMISDRTIMLLSNTNTLWPFIHKGNYYMVDLAQKVLNIYDLISVQTEGILDRPIFTGKLGAVSTIGEGKKQCLVQQPTPIGQSRHESLILSHDELKKRLIGKVIWRAGEMEFRV